MPDDLQEIEDKYALGEEPTMSNSDIMKYHKCKTEKCQATMSEGSPEYCPKCQEDRKKLQARMDETITQLERPTGNSDTPRTDEIRSNYWTHGNYQLPQVWESAGKLERELSAAKKELAEKCERYRGLLSELADYKQLESKLAASESANRELREALSELLDNLPANLCCEDFHHEKRNQHDDGEICKPLALYHIAKESAKAALTTTTKG